MPSDHAIAPPAARDADYDAAVVGGSFAGLAAALQLARARRRVLVVDAGRPRNRFAAAAHGVLGHDGRAPGAILDDARTQLLAYPTAEFRRDEVVDARPRDGAFTLALASGAAVQARRLVLASGLVDELPDVPGLRERWGATVLHCPYCHGYEVADRRLGVLATSPGSVHQALLLPDWSADVTFFLNGVVEPDAAERAALAARGVRLEPRPVEAVTGDLPGMTGVRLRDGATVPLDALFVGSRAHFASPLAARLGCAVDETPLGPVLRTDATRETTVPGVFAAGDAARAPHTVSFALSDGVMAGVAAHRSLVFGAAPHA